MDDLTIKQQGFVKAYLDNIYKEKGFYPSRETIKNKWPKVKILTKDLYFIKCKETKRIKIGISNNPKERLAALQASSPTELELCCVVPYGGIELEKHLHKVFKNYKVKREWYQSSNELTEMMGDFNIILSCQKN